MRCTAGIHCDEGSSEVDLMAKCAGSVSDSLIYPKPAPQYYTTCNDNPLESYMCFGNNTCPGLDVSCLP